MTAAEKTRDGKWHRWLPAAASAAMALGLYAVTLGGTYIYDDVFMIEEDPRVTQPHLWGQYWTRDYFYGGLDNLYRPLVSQSYGLQYWLVGNRPWTYHLVNLLLHAGVCALVAELGRRMVNWRVGLIAGLLFAAHPIHCEVVAGIVGRADLACAIGVVGAMVLFLHIPMTQNRALAIGALSLVAMLSKEQGMLMPALLGALYPVRRDRELDDPLPPAKEREARRQAMLLVFALLFWATVGLIVLREEILKLKFWWDRSFLDRVMQPLASSPPPDRWMIIIALVGRYLQMMLAPVKLSIDYGLLVMQPTISPADPYFWLGILAILAWTIGAVVALVTRRWTILFCLLAMAMTYSMVSNVILIEVAFAERFAYLPSIFFLLLVAVLLARLPTKVRVSVLAALMVLACVRTFTYALRWNDAAAFYEYSLAQQPKSLKIAILVADEDRQSGKFDQGRQLMCRFESMYPDYSELWKMSAMLDEKAGDWEAAVNDWKRALDLGRATSYEYQLEQAVQMRNKLRAVTRP